MKKYNNILLILSILLFSICSSCCKDEEMLPAPNLYDEIADIAVFHGNLNSDIVIVNAQAGPSIELLDQDLPQFITITQAQSALWVNVHQAQTKNPSEFIDSDITFDQAKQYDLESAAHLNRVIDYFKNQEGKTVYVLGISFGAFVTQELIATYGIDVADAYLIITGRLNIDEDAWRSVSEGNFTEFIYDANGDYIIEQVEDGQTPEDRNMARLAAGLGFNRYTERFSAIPNMSKVTYVHGNRDEQVGPLSELEIEFLNMKNANVVLSSNGTHDSTTLDGFDLLKETFKIP